MRRRNNNNGGGGQKHRHGGGGGGPRRYNNNGGGNNSGGGRDSQNLARQKHHATQMREKYSNMARDAQINGDRPDVEYYLQHVDHYTRVLTDIGAIEAERQNQQREQQQAQQPASGGGNDAGPDGGQNQPQDSQQQAGDSSSDGGNDEPITPGNQPRMTRQPRRQNAPQNDHNGAQAANANTDEIPLPGSIINAI